MQSCMCLNTFPRSAQSVSSPESYCMLCEFLLLKGWHVWATALIFLCTSSLTAASAVSQQQVVEQTKAFTHMPELTQLHYTSMIQLALGSYYGVSS